MARINVEDSILTDERFLNLAIRMCSAQHALGAVVWAWRQGQKHFLTTETDRCIPFDVWTKQGCNDLLIDVGLAERKEKGVWIVGAKEQFAWLIQKQNAGEKSVKARKARKKSKKERTLTDANERSTFVNGAEPLSSFLSSLSSNLKLSLPSSVLSTVVERVFNTYPRRIGLEGGKKIILKDIKTVGDCYDLSDAITKYRDYVADPENAVQNVYGFKGFAEVWKQWIPKQQFEEGA